MEKSRAAHRVQLGRDIYKLTFKTDSCRFSSPGQYALVNIDGALRPYQVCDYDSNRFTIVFKESARGGHSLAALEYGDEVETVNGLGRGFDVESIPDGAVLVADAMGVTDMLELSRALLMKGKSFKVILGFDTREDIFLVDAISNVCNDIEVLTLDGSNGREGMASDAVRNASYVCASGSPAMLKSLSGKTSSGQFSLMDMMLRTSDESGMFGVETRDDGMVDCTEAGPVFNVERVVWEDLEVDRWSRSAY